jgi:hypothetical protein
MCRPYIDTNNPQGMQLDRFKNRTPDRFEHKTKEGANRCVF